MSIQSSDINQREERSNNAHHLPSIRHTLGRMETSLRLITHIILHVEPRTSSSRTPRSTRSTSSRVEDGGCTGYTQGSIVGCIPGWVHLSHTRVCTPGWVHLSHTRVVYVACSSHIPGWCVACSSHIPGWCMYVPLITRVVYVRPAHNPGGRKVHLSHTRVVGRCTSHIPGCT